MNELSRKLETKVNNIETQQPQIENATSNIAGLTDPMGLSSLNNKTCINQGVTPRSLNYDYDTLYGQNIFGVDIPYYGKLNNSNIRELLPKWEHLAAYLSPRKRAEYELLDDFGKYKKLYSKFYNMKRNLEKGTASRTRTSTKTQSFNDYITTCDCDFTTFTDNELDSIKKKLESMLSDIDTVIEIKYDEKIEAAKKKVQEIEVSRQEAQAIYNLLIQQKRQLSKDKSIAA